jgi:hypothetical protein
VESNKIRFSILWFFYDLLWFFKYSAKINKKDKTAIIVANHCYCSKTTVKNRPEGKIDGFDSLWGKLDHFIVQWVTCSRVHSSGGYLDFSNKKPFLSRAHDMHMQECCPVGTLTGLAHMLRHRCWTLCSSKSFEHRWSLNTKFQASWQEGDPMPTK